MAWITTFEEKEASGRLAGAYAEVMKHSLGGGRVPSVIKSMGLRPEALLAVWRLNQGAL